MPFLDDVLEVNGQRSSYAIKLIIYANSYITDDVQCFTHEV